MKTYSLHLPSDRLEPGRIILVNNKCYKVLNWDSTSNKWKVCDHTGPIVPEPSEFFADAFYGNILLN